MNNVIYANFGERAAKRPIRVGNFFTRWPRMQLERSDCGVNIRGAMPNLPSKMRVPTSRGFLRTTGQWRLSDGVEEVEVLCMKTGKHTYLRARWMVDGTCVTDLTGKWL